jgi:hypothetical protein
MIALRQRMITDATMPEGRMTVKCPLATNAKQKRQPFLAGVSKTARLD